MGYNMATILWDVVKIVIHHACILENATTAGQEVLVKPVATNYFVVWSSIVHMRISVQIQCQQKYANDILLMRARISYG